jgi:ribosomal 30S subunit maturation factor RimM
MKFEELVSVGKLGKSLDKNGYFTYKLISDLPQRLETVKEVFLIFKDNRVRFVDVEFSADKIRLCDDSIRAAAATSGGVEIALSQDDIDTLRINSGQIPVSHMVIIHKQEKIGDLIEIFDNNAHEILVVKLNNGKEIMIPNVEYFVAGTEKNRIIVRNIEDLLEL